MCSDKSLQGSQSHDLMATSCCPIRLRILVVDHDAEFLAFISGLLKLLRHEVETYRYPIEALSTLWIEDKKFDLVMADIYLHDMDGLQLLKKVREYNLPLIMVSDDNSESAILAALQHGASHYIVKPVCFSDVKNLWQLVMAANRERPSLNILVEHIGSVRGESSSSTNGENNCSKKRKSKEGKSTCVSKKKHKVEWNSQLQARFLEAVNYIGLEKAVPKRILQVMNVAGLTRENVASHLQKYRMFLRKVAAKIATSKLSVDRARNTRRALLYQDLTGQRRTFRDNLQLSVSLNYSASLSRLGRCSHDHEASSSRSPSVPQSRQPYLPKAGSNFSKQPLMMSSTSTPNPFQPATNFSGFQSNNGQRNWSASTPISAEVFYNLGRNNSSGVKIGSNPLMQQSPQPFTTNNYGPSAGIDNPNYASWNGNNVGSLAGNNNSNLMISGIQRRTSTRIAASGGGFVPLMDQNQMVSNGGSATSNDANNNVSSNHNFGYLMMNNGTRNDDYSMYNNVSPIGSSMLGSEGFGGSSSSQLLSSPIFAGGNNNNNNNSIGQENVDVSAFDDPVLQQQQQQQCASSDLVGSSNNSSSTITVVESGSSSSDISSYLKDAEDDDKFRLSHDIFLNENHLKSVTNDKGKGKKVMNSDQDTDKNYDLSDNFWNENRSESANNDQGKGKHVMNSDQSTDEEFDLSDMFLNELHLGPANSDHKGKGKQVMNSDPNASHEVQDADPLKEEPLAQQCPADINYMDLEFHADGLNFVDTPSLENLSLNEDWGSLWRQCSSDWHE